jgi:hypothetical protein
MLSLMGRSRPPRQSTAPISASSPRPPTRSGSSLSAKHQYRDGNRDCVDGFHWGIATSAISVVSHDEGFHVFPLVMVRAGVGARALCASPL